MGRELEMDLFKKSLYRIKHAKESQRGSVAAASIVTVKSILVTHREA